MTTNKIEGIRRTVLFGSLGKEDLRALAKIAVERHLAKDEVLFIAGEEARGLYVVVKGVVRAIRVSAEGREQVLHVEREGATLAEVPVFDEGKYPSTVIADEPSTVLFIAREEVKNFVLNTRKSPSLPSSCWPDGYADALRWSNRLVFVRWGKD